MPYESSIAVPIKTWSQNPPRKQALQKALQAMSVVADEAPWVLGSATWDDEPCLLLHWQATLHMGVLSPQPLALLGEALPRLLAKHPDVKTLVWVMASAGADLDDPFDSLREINTVLETLVRLKHLYGLTVEGVIQEPLGTYGGASLLMATLCNTLWCDSPADLHLTGAK